MSFKAHRKRVLELYDEVIRNNNLLVVDAKKEFADLSEEDKQREVQNIENTYDIILPDKMKSIFFTDNVQICWQYKMNGRKENGGELNFEMTKNIFVDITKTDLSDEISEWEKEIYSQGYRYFDSQPNAGNGICIALQIKNKTITDNVYYIDVIHEDIWLMELGYTQYIECSIYLKGLYMWQYLFCDVDLRSLNFNIGSLRKRLEDYPKLFSGADVSEYLKRYRDRGGY